MGLRIETEEGKEEGELEVEEGEVPKVVEEVVNSQDGDEDAVMGLAVSVEVEQKSTVRRIGGDDRRVTKLKGHTVAVRCSFFSFVSC